MSGQLSPTGIVARSCLRLHRWAKIALTVRGCIPEDGRVMELDEETFFFQSREGREIFYYDDVREIREEVK